MTRVSFILLFSEQNNLIVGGKERICFGNWFIECQQLSAVYNYYLWGHFDTVFGVSVFIPIADRTEMGKI